MNVCCLGVELEDNMFACRHGHVAVGDKSAHTAMDSRRRRCVVYVDIMVAGEIRIQNHASKSTFAASRGYVHGYKRCGEERPVLNYTQPATQLRNKYSPVRRECHACCSINLCDLGTDETTRKPLRICLRPSRKRAC